LAAKHKTSNFAVITAAPLISARQQQALVDILCVQTYKTMQTLFSGSWLIEVKRCCRYAHSREKILHQCKI
jgi:hypothetical protein